MSDARTRVLLVLAVGLLATVLDRPTALSALALTCVIALLAVGGRWSRAALLASLGIAWTTVVSQGLFYGGLPRTPLIELGPVAVWREGVAHGLVQSLRFVASTCAGAALALSTTPDRLAEALVRLRVPWGASFLAVTALRFVPVAASEWWTVRQARARRGRPLLARAPWAWLAAETALLRPVAARALRRASALGESLELRGFDPSVAPRAAAEPWPTLDRAVLGTVGALVLAIVAAEALTWTYVHGLVYVPALRPVYGFVRTWL
ncbi:MAG: hypothetical protein H6738_05450 [Alphaproteobacteria bacterium]|nr:hypothetical protein [Alphaproteobacteria bacterium]MCB9696213.1 hypothetical protein [Alphaproteobacteria bacterium]